MNYAFLEPAKAELDEAQGHFNRLQPGLGDEFLDEVQNAIKKILKNPEAWRKIDKDARRCRTHKFRYGVVYQITTEGILIVAVMHLHRKPGYWADRL